MSPGGVEVVAREVADALRDIEPGEPSLSDGSSGLAVAFDRFDDAWPGEGYGAIADAVLADAVRALARVRLGADLFAGVTGVAWTVAQLRRRSQEHVLRFLDEQLDPLLLGHVRASPWRGAFDLVGGLVGIGVYALERVEEPSGGALLEAVVEQLAALAVETGPGVAWSTRAELLPPWHRELCPHGYINLGLAHGVPGPVALLGAACSHGVAEATAAPLLEGAVAWLLGQDDGDAYGFWIAGSDRGGRARTAWCYGDAGVAAALLVAARGAGRADWEERALAIARRAAARDVSAARVRDASLCHGAAGLAHIFGRMHAATGDGPLGDAAGVWLDRTLAMRDPVLGIAGFPSMTPTDDGGFVPTPKPGLLEGAAGVALALLSAAAPGEASWDRFLLLSAPGLP